ncbi:hypothetical protein [Rhizorhabdus phycosphaerae]|uniref:hypothetical protein n=1 Tax=Rhizorhabdus phycosphaerae TaxID=2711156 RepID=UPI0013ED26C6|nr:hypothetical protein [Rhizorhabdus phycosphaerae]
MTHPPVPHPTGDDAPGTSHPPVDLNMQLAREQTAIMQSEVAMGAESRAVNMGTARDARERIEETAFPARAPHDFEAVLSVEGPEAALDARHATALMAKRLHEALAAGFVSPKSFAHRSRVLRQATARCEA